MAIRSLIVKMYNKETDITIKEFSDKVELVIDKDIFGIAKDNLHELYWYYHEGPKQFEFIYVVKNTSYKINIARSIEAFRNIENPHRRFQWVRPEVNTSFLVKTIYSEEDRRQKRCQKVV